MSKRPVPTALETERCPPHHFHIGSDGIGRCTKLGCKATKVFRLLLPEVNSDEYRRKMSISKPVKYPEKIKI